MFCRATVAPISSIRSVVIPIAGWLQIAAGLCAAKFFLAVAVNVDKSVDKLCIEIDAGIN